jgi:hypothetical protein
MRYPSRDSFERYIKVTRRDHPSPHFTMIADIRNRVREEHDQYIKLLSDPRTGSSLFRRFLKPQEIASRLARLATLETEYNHDLLTIAKFSALVKAYFTIRTGAFK